MPLTLSASLAPTVDGARSLAKCQESRGPKSQMNGWSTTGLTLQCWGALSLSISSGNAGTNAFAEILWALEFKPYWCGALEHLMATHKD